jgi:hypothetical protein
MRLAARPAIDSYRAAPGAQIALVSLADILARPGTCPGGAGAANTQEFMVFLELTQPTIDQVICTLQAAVSERSEILGLSSR